MIEQTLKELSPALMTLFIAGVTWVWVRRERRVIAARRKRAEDQA